MKKLIAGLMVFMMMVTLTACGSSATAKGTVEQYFTAVKKMDTEAMGKLVDPANAEASKMTNEWFESKDDPTAKFFLDYLKENAKKLTYKITDEKVEADTSVVTVESKYVDGGPLIQATFGELITKMFGSAFSGTEPTEEEMGTLLTEIMQEQKKKTEETFKTSTLAINLIKKDGTWYIKEVSDEMGDVITSGFLKAMESFDDVLGNFGD